MLCTVCTNSAMNDYDLKIVSKSLVVAIRHKLLFAQHKFNAEAKREKKMKPFTKWNEHDYCFVLDFVAFCYMVLFR